jgi:hypothetical protein
VKSSFSINDEHLKTFSMLQPYHQFVDANGPGGELARHKLEFNPSSPVSSPRGPNSMLSSTALGSSYVQILAFQTLNSNTIYLFWETDFINSHINLRMAAMAFSHILTISSEFFFSSFCHA